LEDYLSLPEWVAGGQVTEGGADMGQVKTLAERERELQAMMTTPEGREELERLADRYGEETGRHRAAHASVITYIIVHERRKGLIAG
jgi:hypothetical protein